MTSRISLDKLIKEEMKHHVISIFASVLLFLFEIVFFYFEIQRLLQYKRSVQYYKEVIAVAAEPTITAMFPVMILAIFLAAEYFHYLHSQKKTDFYMSLPLNRKKQFWIGVIVCGILFLIPCVFAFGCECTIMYATGYGTSLCLKNMTWMLICKIFAFFACFLTMALAMIMTGHLVIAFFGFGAFCTYVPFILKWLIPVYEEIFFKTYVNEYSFSEVWNYFSPATVIYGLTRDFENWTIQRHWHYLVASFVFVIIIGWIAQRLYIKRPAEAAGRAMAFPKINPFIRFLIVIPFSLYSGWFVFEIAPKARKWWLLVGTLVGVVLLHGVLESVFRFDIKGMLKQKKQLCISMLLCTIFLLVFQLDIFKYDEFVPELENVESVKIFPSYNVINFYNGLYAEQRGGITGETLTDVLEFADIMVAQNDFTFKQLNTNDNIGYVYITYRMKNGRVKERFYYMNLGDETVAASLNKICATRDFKDDFYQLYSVESKDIKKLTYEDVFTTETLSFTEEEQKEFIDIYCEELAKLSFTELNEVDKVARIQLEYKESLALSYQETCDIYRNFNQTIEFLEEHGLSVNGALEEGKITSLEIYSIYDDETEQETSGYVITDEELLENVKKELIMTELYDDSNYVSGVANVRAGKMDVLVNGRHQTCDVWIRENTEKILETAIE